MGVKSPYILSVSAEVLERSHQLVYDRVFILTRYAEVTNLPADGPLDHGRAALLAEIFELCEDGIL